MSWFGLGAFGSGPFGAADFGRLALYEQVPARRRALDTNQELERFLDALGEELGEFVQSIARLPDGRDALKAQSFDTYEEVIVDGSAVVDDPIFGLSAELTLAVGEVPKEIGPGYSVLVGSTRYRVLRVRSRDEPDARNTILIDAKTDPQISPGTTMRFEAPNLLARLGGDYGVEIDEYQPVFAQRAEVSHVHRLIRLTGSAEGYRVRGIMRGFTVEVKQLWKLGGGPDPDLPSNKVHLLNGTWYTEIAPKFLRFDEIPADLGYTDPDEGNVGLLDRSLVYEDASPDGLSVAGAYAENVLEGWFAGSPPPPPPLVEPSTVDVTGSSAVPDPSLYDLPQAWSVQVTMTQGQRDKIGDFTRGKFFLVSVADGSEYPIELEVSYAAPSLELITSGPVPPPNGQYTIRYEPGFGEFCAFCPSRTVLVAVEITPDVVAFYNGDGVLMDAAISRMVERLIDFMPVHVRVGSVAKVVKITVSPGVPQVGVSITRTVPISAPFAAYFDDVAADDLTTDTIGPYVSSIVIT